VNSDEVAAKVIDGEAIIINLTTGVYYSMDSVGGKVWSMVEAHHDISTIAETLAAQFDVASDHCRHDVEELVEQLLNERLIVETNEVPSESPVVDASPEKLPYSSPTVSIYRDMGDLLALDPPVPGLEPIPWSDPSLEQQQ
jgi:hypothetical protein